MTALILLSILTLNFIIYVGLIWALYGVQPSVSDSFYKVFWFFTLFCALLSIPLIAMADTAPLPMYQFLYFLSGAPFLLVGVAAQIKKKYVMKVHGPAAIAGIGFSLLTICVQFGGWYILGVGIGLLVAGLLALLDVKNKIWWAEIVAFITVIGLHWVYWLPKILLVL